jgi:hypothetical protein
MPDIFARVAMLERYVAEQIRRREDIERRVHNLVRPARVTAVDPAKGLVKVAYAADDEGKDVVSPWIPWMERAGAIKTWTPPAIGEQVHMFSPSGDVSGHSWVLPGGFSETNRQPHDRGAEHKMQIGGASILMTGDKVVITAGQIAFDGEVTLGGQPGAGELVHRKGDRDSDGDIAVGSATKVRAV